MAKCEVDLILHHKAQTIPGGLVVDSERCHELCRIWPQRWWIYDTKLSTLPSSSSRHGLHPSTSSLSLYLDFTNHDSSVMSGVRFHHASNFHSPLSYTPSILTLYLFIFPNGIASLRYGESEVKWLLPLRKMVDKG